MQVGNSKVKKILMGDKVVYRDSDGWIPLKLGPEVTGNVFFKDNGDGTGKIAGNISANMSKDGTKPDLCVYAPQGYSFSEIDWMDESFGPGIMATFGYSGSSGGIGGPIFIQVKSGNMYMYNPNTSSGIATIRFTQSATSSKKVTADAAIIGITKV